MLRKYHQKFKAPKKPTSLNGELSKAWDYLVNCNGVCRIDQFDEDFSPAGPAIRAQLADLGVQASTSGTTTIIFLPES